MQLFTCLVASVVAMVTAAPIANDEKLINTVVSDGLDRAKRAEELLVFGNQQNEPRIPSKKSDPRMTPLEIPAPDAVPPGEADEGSMIVAHEEIPVSDDVEGRIEAAQEGGNQKAEIDDAMESAMHAAVSSAFDDPEAEAADAGDGSPDSGETVGNESSDEAPPVDEAGEDESDENEEDAVGSESSESETAESDDAEKELQEATASESQSPSEADVAGEGGAESAPDDASEELSPETAAAAAGEDNQNDDEVQDFLNELHKQDGGENNLDASPEIVPDMNDYYKNMYQYMAPSRYPEEQDDSYPVYPYLPIYYRRRRSSPHFRRNQQMTLGNHQRTRRIKRDLFDDLALSDIGDTYRTDSDSYLPLSDEELEYFYSKLLPYLAEAYAEESDDDDESSRYDALDSLRPYSLLGDLEPEEEQVYEPQIPLYPERPYEEMELSAPMQNEYPMEKRDIMDYYAAPQRKRYFFPFSDEPETHWGAFVPEKRNYDEAIHRLQRLAMALSDEPGPYYSEILGEYRKK